MLYPCLICFISIWYLAEFLRHILYNTSYDGNYGMEENDEF